MSQEETQTPQYQPGFTTEELIAQGYPEETALAHPANLINNPRDPVDITFTTKELVDQGYTREFAENHPLNAINVYKRKVAAQRTRSNPNPSPRALREGVRLVVGAGGVVMTPDELADAQRLDK